MFWGTHFDRAYLVLCGSVYFIGLILNVDLQTISCMIFVFIQCKQLEAIAEVFGDGKAI